MAHRQFGFRMRNASRHICCLALSVSLSLAFLPSASVLQAHAETGTAGGVQQLAQQAAPQVQGMVDAARQAQADGQDPHRALAKISRLKGASADAAARLSKSSRKRASKAEQRAYYLTNAQQASTVKMQDPWGACWAFGLLSALESSLLKQRDAQENAAASSSIPQLGGLVQADADSPLADLSEHHLTYFSLRPQTQATAGNQAGEGMALRSKSRNAEMGNGGIDEFAEALLSTRRGIVTEADEPYTYRDADGSFHVSNPADSLDVAPFDEAAADEDWSLADTHRLDSNGVFITDIDYLASPALWEPADDSSNIYEDADDYRYAGYDASATAAIKEALVERGAVALGVQAEQALPSDTAGTSAGSSEYFSFDNWCQYSNMDLYSDVDINHEVSIVGWDDDYPAQNFTGTVGGSPADDAEECGYPNGGNGAWLVKNNWGSADYYRSLGYDTALADWGIPYTEENDRLYSGLYWISYYDHGIDSAVSFSLAGDGEGYDNVHQYDYLGMASGLNSLSSTDTIRMANVFTAGSDDAAASSLQPASAEVLKAVSARTEVDGATVTARVYLMEEGSMVPTAGTLVSRKTETFAHRGFHVIELDEHVALPKGQRYAVVETISYESEGKTTYDLQLECGYNSRLISSTDTATAVAHAGETYVKVGTDPWTTPAALTNELISAGTLMRGLSYGNAMIKAYTDNAVNVSDQVQVSVDRSSPCVYNGLEQRPDVTVTCAGAILEEGSDYTVGYSDNINAGTARVTVTGVGERYVGTAHADFSIEPAPALGNVVAQVEPFTLALDTSRRPSISVSAGGAELVAGTDYTVSYSGIDAPGTGRFSVVLKRNYTGTVAGTLTVSASRAWQVQHSIVPPVLKKKPVRAKKSLTAKWGRLGVRARGYTTGFELCVATNKKFTKGVRTARVQGAGKTQAKAGKLKRKTRYYLRVRSYCVVDGQTLCSAWSKSVSAKTR